MSTAHTPDAELPGLRKLSPREQSQRARASAWAREGNKPSCERAIWISLFFDGTNNNKDRDTKDRSYSNVAVLYKACRNSPENGYFRHYLPGLGTPFPEIGEKTETDDGKALGVGGGARIHYAMIQVYNSVYRTVVPGEPLVSPQESLSVVTSKEAGLQTVWLLGGGKRREYFRGLETRLTSVLNEKRPVVKLINVSVFGFSRGAAEARAFCNWMVECCRFEGGGYAFCGIPIRFQFLGVFDTVASVGLADSSPVGNGFMDWADGTMGVPTAIERCVHLAAAHEIRQSFPLSSARDDGAYPSNCLEMVYPGAHCDVGGGYAPGDQGKARSGRQDLPSQVPLLKMYLEAQKTGVPLLTCGELDKLGDHQTVEDLQISAQLASRFYEYAKWSRIGGGTVEKVLFEHMRMYWRWRLQVGPKFKELNSFKSANEQDKEDLLASEQDFLSIFPQIERAREQQGPVPLAAQAAEAERRNRLPVPPQVAQFFDEHIHDSHASFRLYGPMTAYDRKVAIAKIKAKHASGKKLNPLEQRALARDAVSPGTFPVMRDADIVDLRDMSSWTSNVAVSAITDTRREQGGHVRERKVFDKS